VQLIDTGYGGAPRKRDHSDHMRPPAK